MNEGRDDLRGWIAGEAEGVLPPAGSEERGWARLEAALAAGAAPRADVLTPPGRGWAPWVVLGVVLAAALGWVLWPRAEVGAIDVEAPVRVREASEVAPVQEEVRNAEEVAPARGLEPAVEPGVEAAPARGLEPAVEPGVEVAPARALEPAVVPADAPRVQRRRKAAPVPGDSFAAELRIVAAAQAALQVGDWRGALRELAGHARRFPRGHFAQDRAALRAVALCRGGQRRAGERLGREFLAAHPDSIHGDRVREACGL